jgi:hypothetical protein
MGSVPSGPRAFVRAIGSGGSSGVLQSYGFGDPTKDNFVLERSPKEDWGLKSSQGVPEERIQEITAQAIERVSASDFGEDVVYQPTLQVMAFEIGRSTPFAQIRRTMVSDCLAGACSLPWGMRVQ